MVKTELVAHAILHKYVRDKKTWKDHGTTYVPVSPALWVIMSAFVTKRARGRPSVLTTATETALLLQHLSHGPGRPLAWTRAALTAPPHLRRFLTESAALALTLGMAQASGWDPLRHDVLNVDDLPVAKNWLLPDRGPRPDFVYQTGEGLRAAEARGRSSKRRHSPRPDAAQCEKIHKLDDWAAKVKRPALRRGTSTGTRRTRSARTQDPFPWSMTWAWMTDLETHIDMFDSAPSLSQPPSVAKISAAMEDRTAELVSQMIEVSIEREDSESVHVFDQVARAALRPVGPVRARGFTEWLAVLIWQERLHQDNIRTFQSSLPGNSYPGVDNSYIDVMLSGHIGAVLCQTEYAEPPTWERITEMLVSLG